MKAAFDCLRKAGYHMFRYREYDSWKCYLCYKKPYYEDGVEVSEFADFID